MSHFTVLAIVPHEAVVEAQGDLGVAIEAMMAPYSESLEWEPYHDYLDAEAVNDMAKYYEIDPSDLAALAAKMESWSGKVGGVDAQGLYGISTWNQDSTWDWYEIGGRWAGSMLGKLDARSGDLVWGDRFSANPLAALEQEGVDRVELDDRGCATVILCDGGRKRSLDLEAMRERAGDGAVPGYATLTKDGWLAKGRMGWFGMSNDTPLTQAHYREAANAAIDAAADDDYLVMLDAHV